MKLQELDSHIEIDLKGALARFSNMEAMYLKYLRRFNDEPTYAQLLEAVSKQDFKEIETTAHTLKGIAGNLGLTALFIDFDEIVKAVRAGDNAKALDLCAQISPKVEATRKAIAEIE